MVFIDGAAVDGDVGLLQQKAAKIIRLIERRANKSSNATLERELEKCVRFAKAVACHTVFPYCHPMSDVPTQRPVCKSSCDNFRTGGICERFINQQTSPSLYSKLMLNCDPREHPAGSIPECIPISIDTPERGEFL